MPGVSFAVFDTVIVFFFRYHPSSYRDLFYKLKTTNWKCGYLFTNIICLATDTSFAFLVESREVIRRETLIGKLEKEVMASRDAQDDTVQMNDMLLMQRHHGKERLQASADIVTWFFVYHQSKADMSLISDWMDREFVVPAR